METLMENDIPKKVDAWFESYILRSNVPKRKL